MPASLHLGASQPAVVDSDMFIVVAEGREALDQWAREGIADLLRQL